MATSPTGLDRLAQPLPETASRGPPPRPPRRAAPADYSRVDDGSGDEHFVDGQYEDEGKRRRWFCCTAQGVGFNFVVGVVICAYTGLLVVEADIGLIGFGKPQWTSFETDLNLLNLGDSVQSNVEEGVREGAQLDTGFKDRFFSTIEGRTSKGGTIPFVIDNTTGIAGTDGPQTSSGAYTVYELFFVVFFTAEILVRMCDMGFYGYCADLPWSLLDVSVVILGILDLGLPVCAAVAGKSAQAVGVLAFLRVTRVLRVLRILRVSRQLRTIAQACLTAFAAVLRVGALILLIDLSLAVPLTSLIGQRSYMWEGDMADEVDAWFGSIGRSMQTLFAVMTLSGWDRMAIVMTHVFPGVFVVPSIVLYIAVCCFSAISLVTGVVADWFVRAHSYDMKCHQAHLEVRRTAFHIAVANILAASNTGLNGHITREEFGATLETHPIVLTKLRSFDVDATSDDLFFLFDRLLQESSVEGAVRVDSLAEAIASTGAEAKASSVLDLKQSVLAGRREHDEKTAAISKEVAGHHTIALGLARSTKDEVANTLQNVNSAQEAISAISSEVAAMRNDILGIGKRCDEIEKRGITERRDRAEAFAAVLAKLDTMNHQNMGAEKLDVILSNQAASRDTISALATATATQAALVAEQERTTKSILAELADLAGKVATAKTPMLPMVHPEAAPAVGPVMSQLPQEVPSDRPVLFADVDLHKTAKAREPETTPGAETPPEQKLSWGGPCDTKLLSPPPESARRDKADVEGAARELLKQSEATAPTPVTATAQANIQEVSPTTVSSVTTPIAQTAAVGLEPAAAAATGTAEELLFGFPNVVVTETSGRGNDGGGAVADSDGAVASVTRASEELTSASPTESSPKAADVSTDALLGLSADEAFDMLLTTGGAGGGGLTEGQQSPASPASPADMLSLSFHGTSTALATKDSAAAATAPLVSPRESTSPVAATHARPKASDEQGGKGVDHMKADI
eukprot:TRINITY_DN36581_c0_g1_i2.p1 TRINITY_DN36581_c0_g1~~TRINITY_DN36581_c0_g1_i2.p1  ORF type:complete len:973 (-),score=203.19 TRINITY_DN36581_c0_g1_i2:44-2962(-)